MKETTLESKQIFKGRLISVRVDSVRLPDGRVSVREVVEHPGAIAVVPVDEEGNVVLVQQFRYAAGDLLLEIPAGTLEEGESPEDCARRELQEEIGCFPGSLEKLFEVYLAPGYSTELIHYFLATGLTPSVAVHDHDEFIKVHRIPLLEALKMIDAGQIRDAKTVAGIALAARRLPHL